MDKVERYIVCDTAEEAVTLAAQLEAAVNALPHELWRILVVEHAGEHLVPVPAVLRLGLTGYVTVGRPEELDPPQEGEPEI
jgi:hypothetical protein